eukprot:g29508.t1
MNGASVDNLASSLQVCCRMKSSRYNSLLSFFQIAVKFLQMVADVNAVVVMELRAAIQAVELRAQAFTKEQEEKEAAREAGRAARGQKAGTFQGLTFALPNSLGVLKNVIKKEGGKIVNKVNKKVQYAVAASAVAADLDENPLAQQAKAQGIPVVSKEWIEKSAQDGALCTDEALFFNYVKVQEAGANAKKTLTLGLGTRKFLAWLTQARHSVNLLAQSQDQESSLACWLCVVLDPFAPNAPGLARLLEEILAPAVQVMKAKEPKGTRDTEPFQMAVRNKAFAIIRATFDRHGAVGIDTPIFERKETLMGKYGEDQKLIYDLKDQGGEILSLRYDLTVPFARYCASHGVKQIKRYHIGTVYRRDQPNVNRGRYREFFQCDFDVAGPGAVMSQEADVLKVLTEILDALQLGEYRVKLNHRKLLDAMMAVCGVPAEKFRTICSAIDKLDKEPWEKVREEMTVEKGLAPDVADKINPYVTGGVAEASPNSVLAKLRKDSKLCAHPSAAAALDEIEVLFNYLRAMKCLHRISFDLSLARGLHYYTGVIYEAMLTTEDGVGSIAAGGRYDGLIGMFSPRSIPAVGVSVGISRILAIMEQQESKRGGVKGCPTQVLVASTAENSLVARMEICALLWEAGVNAEYLYEDSPKHKHQLEYAIKEGIPYIVFIEPSQKTLQIRNITTKQDDQVGRGEVCAFFASRLKVDASAKPVASAGASANPAEMQRLEQRAEVAEKQLASVLRRLETIEKLLVSDSRGASRSRAHR